MKKILSLLLLAGFVSTARAANIGSPQEVNLKIFDFWVSPNADCTDMVRVYDNPSADYQNMVTGPVFGSLVVPNGTYNCVAWKMSDVITLKPDFTSDGGHCVQGTTYTRDLFRMGDSSMTPGGATINATTSLVTPDNMYIYVSVDGNNTSNSGTTPSSPGKLNQPYVVGGDNNATLVVDFTNGIEDTGGSCSPEGVSFGFRYN